MNKEWSVISREYLFRKPWLTVRRDHVKLPTGAEIPDYYVLEYPDWVNVIAITDDDQYVMVRQYRHGLGQTRYELCAGVVEEGEPPLLAAQRELLEETGFGGGEWQLLMTSTGNASTTNNLTHSYVARGVRRIDTQHLEESEDITVHLLSRDQMRQLLREGQLMQSLMLAPLWKHFATL